MSKYAIIAAGLAIALTPGVADSRMATRAGVCPAVSILGDATRVTVMEQGKIDLKAEILTPALGCTLAKSTAKASLSFWVKSAIAPEASVSERKVPYFVAIISNGQVIAKEIFDLKLPFANGEHKVMVKENIAHIDIPIASGKAAEDYSVTIGFQLTPEQAAYNRTAPQK
jgi:hypothetical protein